LAVSKPPPWLAFERSSPGSALVDAVTLIPGYFAETLEKLPERKYSFVHLDCDIYDSYHQTLRYFIVACRLAASSYSTSTMTHLGPGVTSP
jgi:hypothetical protein